MMDILYRLRRFLMVHQLVAGNIKITVEFTNPETQTRAEYLLRMQAMKMPVVMDPRMIDALCEERPVTFMGITFQVKRYLTAYRNCICPECVKLRNFRQDAIGK